MAINALRTVIYILIVAGMACGAPIPCVTGTLSDYLALPPDGCVTSNDYFFMHFTFTTDLPIAASQIIITPLLQGLIFSSNALMVTGSQSGSVSIGYTVDPKPPDDYRGTQSLSVPDPGSVSTTTDLCIGSPFSPLGSIACPASALTVTMSAPELTSSIQFPPNKLVGVQNTILLDANGGTAALLSLRQEFETTVPEPATIITTAAILLFLWRRR